MLHPNGFSPASTRWATRASGAWRVAQRGECPSVAKTKGTPALADVHSRAPPEVAASGILVRPSGRRPT